MNHRKIRKLTLMLGMAGLMAAAPAPAQFTAGKLAVLRAGDNNSYPWSSLGGAHQSPAFIDEFDPVTPIVIPSTDTGTNGPIFSVAIPTNDPGALWFNGHAGTEGYLSRSSDASTLAFSGYGGDILAEAGTPSQLNINRGICVIDVISNTYIPYEGSAWYGLGAGSQTNPRGVVSDDGTNNFFGSGSLDGTEWFNPSEQNPPVTVQNLNSSRCVKIINGVFYCSLQQGDGGGLYPQGIYNLQDFGGGFPVGLPEGDAFFLNLVMPASALYPNVEGFDLNPQGNIAYTADNTYGIQKYIEVGGSWTLACAFGITNNTSTGPLSFPSSYTGCFGLVVDWSGSYPVVFATTTEGAGGFANSNRLIRIDDTNNWTDGLLHTNGYSLTNLATGWSANVAFRGLAWAPDCRPAITSQPASQSVTVGTPVTFSVVATANFANTYEWLVNGIQDPTQTAATYSVPSASANATYQVIVTNVYGAVTSSVAALTVTASPTSPSLTSPVPALNLTNAVYDTITIPVTASGTTPLSYQWYQVTSQGSTQLSDNGGDFTGTATATLTIGASSTADSGSYYVTVNNSTGPASYNLAATVSIVSPGPIIFLEPPATAVVASNGVVSFTVDGYPLDASYQWYQGSTPLSDGSHWNGSQGQTLTDKNAVESDQTTYYCVVSANGLSVTSSIVTLSVETPAPYSALPYSSFGSAYTQNFDSLPDPGITSVNNSTGIAQVINGVTYFTSNPFDFSAPLVVTGDNGMGGLNLPAMVGWFSSDLGAEQIQATSGDNTTGLIVSFGCTNAINTVNPLYPTNNRALGMISSPATAGASASDAVFALRIRNVSGQNLTNFNLSYVSELWRDTLVTNSMTNYYYVDTYGNNTTPTNNWTGGLTNLIFATNWPGISKSVTKIWGTNQPVSTTNMVFTNIALAAPVAPGGILWIVWEEFLPVSGGQGIGIDNLVFTSGTPDLSLSMKQAGASVVLSWPQMFTTSTLQYNPNLANANGWQNVTQAVTVMQGMNTVTWPISGTQVYFRLIH